MFNRYRDLVWEDEKVLEMGGGDGLHKNVNILNVTKLYTYKWLKQQILYYLYFIIIKQIISCHSSNLKHLKTKCICV